MSSKAFANEDVMEDYMSSLLTEEPIVEDVQRQAVEQLLKTAPAPRTEPFEAPVVDPINQPIKEAIEAKVLHPQAEEKQTPVEIKAQVAEFEIPEDSFQVLLFEISGLTLAVPLTELGGIHQIDSINPLFGKPDWFKGVLLHRDEKFNVVDTAKWIMPEKSAEKLAESTKYQYLIVLGESGWGLGCESLVATETIQPDEVKWRKADGNRPWLAGMVKKKMCALINIHQLVDMLNQGLSSND